ncbi:hypothetical protein N0V90_002068 [Kalmusia sp. IMI 367209]|nr:hypothetical protein N0V90_002068 [Kalmusia sp. IMI 367209]
MYYLSSFSTFLLLALPLGTANAAALSLLPRDNLERYTARVALPQVETSNFLAPTPFKRRTGRRAAITEDDYKLKTEETWYWNIEGIHPTDTPITSLTLSIGSSTPIAKAQCSFTTNSGAQPWNGRTVPLERLEENVADIQCREDEDTIAITWRTSEAYNLAKENWEWVNAEEGRYIALVTNTPKCRGYRQAYKVSHLDCDSADDSLTMTLDASPVDFNDAFPSVKFYLSTLGVGPAPARRRDLSKRAEFSIPLAQDFSDTEILKTNVSDIDIALKCSDCKTTGTLDINVEANFDALNVFSAESPVDGSIEIIANDLSATIGLDLELSAALTEAFDQSVTFLEIPLITPPLSIPGVANIGPTLTINLDAKIDEVTATATISAGSVTMKIPPGARAKANFLNDQDDTSSDFTPEFSTTPPALSAGISATANFGPNIILGVSAEILNQGIAGGLALAAPQLALKAAVATDQTCPGVDLTADLTAQLNAFAGIGNVNEVAAENTFELVGTSTQIFSSCVTVFDAMPTGDAPAVSALPAPADPLPTSPVGGVVGSAFNDAGCKMATNSDSALAPQLCGKDGGNGAFSEVCPGVENQCCQSGMACGVASMSGVQGLCCT